MHLLSWQARTRLWRQCLCRSFVWLLDLECFRVRAHWRPLHSLLTDIQPLFCRAEESQRTHPGAASGSKTIDDQHSSRGKDPRAIPRFSRNLRHNVGAGFSASFATARSSRLHILPGIAHRVAFKAGLNAMLCLSEVSAKAAGYA